MTRTPQTIVISGAGIGGLTLAVACARSGMRVDVVERAREPSEAGAGIQLGPNAMHVLADLGLNDVLEQVSFAPNRAVLRRYTDGKPLFTTKLNPAHQQRYGQNYLHIHRADLHNALLQAATAHGACVHFGQEARTFERHGTSVTLGCNDSNFTADVLAGADGIHSVVRSTLFGNAPARFTGQVAWRGLVPADRVSEHLISHDANAWIGPGNHFVAYYVRNGRLINFVAVREQTDWTEESWQAPGNIDDVKAAFDGWDPVINELLSASDSCYLWGLFDRPPLARWQQDRVVLLGDACHPMLPFMAQGAAMAIEDAWVLARLLTDPSETTESALINYESSRKPRTLAVQQLSSRNARRYHLDNATSVVFRNIGFRMASAFPSITHFMLDPVYGLDVTQSTS